MDEKNILVRHLDEVIYRKMLNVYWNSQWAGMISERIAPKAAELLTTSYVTITEEEAIGKALLEAIKGLNHD